MMWASAIHVTCQKERKVKDRGQKRMDIFDSVIQAYFRVKAGEKEVGVGRGKETWNLATSTWSKIENKRLDLSPNAFFLIYQRTNSSAIGR
jgi:hypothetical protein